MLTVDVLNQRYPNFKFILISDRNNVAHFSVDDGSSIYWNNVKREGSIHYPNCRFDYFQSLEELGKFI